ncbi:unnamed protein product, partial [Oikopleura dioica]
LTDGPRDKAVHHRRWRAAKSWIAHVIDATKIGSEIHFLTSSDPNHKVNIRHASGIRDIHSSETTVELLQELNTDLSKETKIIAPEIRMLDQIVDH